MGNKKVKIGGRPDSTSKTISDNKSADTASNEKGRRSNVRNVIASAGKRFLHNIHMLGVPGKYNRNLFSAILSFVYIILEEIVLLALLLVYFIIGATAVTLYVVFYEKIYEKLVTSRKKKAKTDLYGYKGKYPDLKLRLEES